MDLFKIKKQSGKIRPYYKVEIQVDENDGDYKTETTTMSYNEFKKMQYYYYLLMFSEAGQQSGRLEDFKYYAETNIPYSSWHEQCHTLKDISIHYFDENNIEHEVQFEESHENTLYAIYKVGDEPSEWEDMFPNYEVEDTYIEEGTFDEKYEENLRNNPPIVHLFETIDWEELVKEFKTK